MDSLLYVVHFLSNQQDSHKAASLLNHYILRFCSLYKDKRFFIKNILAQFIIYLFSLDQAIPSIARALIYSQGSLRF